MVTPVKARCYLYFHGAQSLEGAPHGNRQQPYGITWVVKSVMGALSPGEAQGGGQWLVGRYSRAFPEEADQISTGLGRISACWRWGGCFPCGAVVKKVPANARDARNVGLTPGVGKVPWSACLLQSSATLCDPMAPMRVACQAPLSKGLSRQEYWSGLLCPPPGNLPDPRIEPESPASPVFVGGFLTAESQGKPIPWSGKWQPTPVFLPGAFRGKTKSRVKAEARRIT